MLIQKVCDAFSDHKVDYAIVGGYAVALHGAVRGTMDLDVIIQCNLKAFLAIENAMRQLGFESRVPVTGHEVFHFREEFIKNRNLIAWSFYNPKDLSEVVDIILTHDLSKMRKKKIKLSQKNIFILSKKDLIQMKKESARPQDLADVEALERLP